MIPVNEPALPGNELEYVSDCIETAWISSAGDYVEGFEQRWAEYCRRDHGVAVSSGTAALDIAVRALEIGEGDEVILPTFTIISCAQAVVRAGATPVLVDSRPDTWTMDIDQVQERITPRTKAIMPVHMYGHPVEMDPLLDLREDHDIALIEDAAQAHGAEYRSRWGGTPSWTRCGGFGDISIFSFYANKPVTTGEGGMALTDDQGTADRLRRLRDLCFQPERRFLHDELGYNYRMTNVQAAIGLAQAERIDEIVSRKREMGQRYRKRLSDLEGLQLPPDENWARTIYWMFGILVDESTGHDAESLAASLGEHGIQTRPFFLGMHRQPALHNLGLFDDETDQFPIADELANRGLYLPSGTALSDQQQTRVIEALREVLE